jgi:hypothetical protein
MKNTFRTLTCLVLASATLALVGCKTSTRYGRSTGEYIDDKTVTSHVKGALNEDSLTKGADIKVETFRGNVHLTGFVDHPIQRDRASEITRSVQGVEFFKNDIIAKNQIPGTTRMTESAGAERMNSRSNMQSSSQSSQSSSGWERGFGGYRSRPAATMNESAGAERHEYKVETNQQNQNNR